MTGQTLGGRYHLLRLVGTGGMASVYEAQDTLLLRRVAVKLLHPQFAHDPAFVERFKNEARTASSLLHPNIVGVYDLGQDGDSLYLLLEFVDGETLRDLVDREGALSPEGIAGIGEQVCAALSFAHQRGIIHRDVKPQNILLTSAAPPSGERTSSLIPHASSLPLAKLADFGIARLAASAGVTQTDVIMATVHYMAPEQVQGMPATPLSDLYSVGVVLYLMATGRLPFEGETSLATAMRHVRELPPSPRSLNPRLTPPLEAVILKAMAKDPADRYRSARELAEALRSAAGRAYESTVPLIIPERPAPVVTLERSEVTALPEPVPAGGGAGRWLRDLAFLGAGAVLGAGLVLFALFGPQNPARARNAALLAQASPTRETIPTATVTGTPVPSATLPPTTTVTPTTTPQPSPTPIPPTATRQPTVAPTPEPRAFRQEFGVNPGQTICQRVSLQAGNRVEGQFTVRGGGGNDINFAVLDPGGVQLQRRDRAANSQTFAFAAARAGEYCLQFDNNFSARANKNIALTYTVFQR